MGEKITANKTTDEELKSKKNIHTAQYQKNEHYNPKSGQRPKQAFLKSTHRGLISMKDAPTPLIIITANKTTLRHHLTMVKAANLKNSINNKWKGVEKREPSLAGGNTKLVQPLESGVQRLLEKLRIELSLAGNPTANSL